MDSLSGVLLVEPMGDEGKGLRVGWTGYTIDPLVDLGNAAHYEVHDASQAFSVWSENNLGTTTYWYFLMPNLHGVKDVGTHYNGIAIKLRHGTAISWDRRVVRHCTAVPCLGISNQVYTTFTAAKDRIVGVGRVLLAARSKLLDGVCFASAENDSFN